MQSSFPAWLHSDPTDAVGTAEPRPSARQASQYLHAPNTSTATGPVKSVLLAAMRRVCHAMCGLRGHSTMLHFEPHRLCLQGALCGHDTPGWNVGGAEKSL